MGLGIVIEVDSTAVLDIEVLCNICNARSAQKKEKTPEEFEAWKSTHRCHQNVLGKSGAMESEAAV